VCVWIDAWLVNARGGFILGWWTLHEGWGFLKDLVASCAVW
jgi:hypothetical protein